MDLGSLRILGNCPKGHKVIGLMDGDFCVAEIHLPPDTKMSEVDRKVREFFNGQL